MQQLLSFMTESETAGHPRRRGGAAPGAARLLATAGRMDAEASEKLRPRETNTPRKLKFARQAALDGSRLRRAASYARAYARAIEAGTVPDALVGFRPARAGLLRAGSRRTECVSNGYHGYLVETGEWLDTSAEASALRGLADRAEPEARARADAEARGAEIRRLEDEVRFMDIPDFFPTPKPVIDAMLEEAEIRPGHRVLEPSAGKGDIAEAIRASCPGARLHLCEVVSRLQSILAAKFPGVPLEGDFLESAAGEFDRIVMNPPFGRGADARHVGHAYSQLAPGGRLVAVMANGARFRKFARWLESVGGRSRALDSKAFAGPGCFRRTGTATRLVVIER